MFYPILEKLKNDVVDDISIQSLDSWLGSRRRFTYESLNPLQFSIDSNVDEELAMLMFSLCVKENIKLLNVRYEVVCPICDTSLYTTYNRNDIQQYYICDDCKNKIESIDNVQIWFELLEDPNPNEIIKRFDMLKKVPALDVKTVGKYAAKDESGNIRGQIWDNI